MHDDIAMAGLPGGEILEKGLRDLQSGVTSVEGLLVLIGRSRLTAAGIDVPVVPPANDGEPPEHALYALLNDAPRFWIGWSRSV